MDTLFISIEFRQDLVENLMELNQIEAKQA